MARICYLDCIWQLGNLLILAIMSRTGDGVIPTGHLCLYPGCYKDGTNPSAKEELGGGENVEAS